MTRTETARIFHQGQNWEMENLIYEGTEGEAEV
jgi:hypothetical protein